LLIASALGIAVCSVFNHAGPAFAADVRPNVLIILVDDLGYGDLSCYGAQDLRTPHIDRLMSQGVRFNEFYANSCVCSPTRAALLTGRYPDLVGVPGVVRTYDNENWGYLHPDAVMLPALFEESGYRTSLVGKWHLGLRPENHPNRRGFRTFKGFLGDMMDDYWDHRRHGINYMREDQKEIDPNGHATDLFTQWSIDMLEEQAAEADPFFLYLAYNAPHAPIQPPEQWRQAYREREPGTTPQRAEIAAFIEHLDDGIGRVLSALDRLGLSGNTIVVFSSDNGGSLRYGSSNASLRGGKTQMYEGGLKVGACFRWPDRLQPRVTDYRALTMDILPTLADLCGVSLVGSVDGASLKQELLHGDQAPFARVDYHVWLQGSRKEALRDGDWKLVREQEEGVSELYDIANDPYEEVDLAIQQPQRAAELDRRLLEYRERSERVPWRRPALEKDR
jgi:arylsulfatase A-like enzyme